MNARILGLLVMGGVLLACVRPVNAELITIQIEAVVDTVEDEGNYLEGQILPGNIITGYYTYESSTEDTNPSSQVGDYWHYSSPYGVFLSVDDFSFQTDFSNVEFIVEVINDYPSGDGYLFRSYNNLNLPNGILVDHISWSLNDDTSNAISSDSLPLAVPVLSDWQSGNDLRIDGERGGYIIDAHVTSAIPEPATVLLFCFGIALIKRRR